MMYKEVKMQGHGPVYTAILEQMVQGVNKQIWRIKERPQ